MSRGDELGRRLAEDKALRDAALGLFSADLALIRADLTERGIGQRIADRLGESTLEVVDEVADYAEENKGKVAAAVAAVVLWFARGPIIRAIEDWLGLEDEEPEPAEPRRRSIRSGRD